MGAMLKYVVIILNTFLISSYLTLNVELVIGLSLVLVFFIIYEGSRKIGLSGTFLAVDSVYYFYYYLLALNGLILGVLKLLLEKVDLLSSIIHPASFLAIAVAMFQGYVLKAYVGANWLSLSILKRIIGFFSFRASEAPWGAASSLGLEECISSLFISKFAKTVEKFSQGSIYVS